MKERKYFELIGYSKDYYNNNKYLGSKVISIKEKDRNVLGYEGRIKEVLEEGVLLDNKKTILKGKEVITELIELNGKMI